MRDETLDKECPGEDRLLDLHFGQLNSIESRNIEDHLTNCEHCSALKATFASIGTSFAMLKEEIGQLPMERPSIGHKNSVTERIVGMVRVLSLRPLIATSLGVVITFALGLYLVTTGGLRNDFTSIATPTASMTSSSSPSIGGESKPDTNSEQTETDKFASVTQSDEIRLAYVEPQTEDGVRLTDILSELE